MRRNYEIVAHRLCEWNENKQDARDFSRAACEGVKETPRTRADAARHLHLRQVHMRRCATSRGDVHPAAALFRVQRAQHDAPLRSNGIAISKSIDHAGMAPGRLCAIWHENPAISHSTGQNRLFFTGKRAISRSTGHMPIRMPFGATLCHGSIGHMPIRLLCNVIPCHAEQTSSTHF